MSISPFSFWEKYLRNLLDHGMIRHFSKILEPFMCIMLFVLLQEWKFSCVLMLLFLYKIISISSICYEKESKFKNRLIDNCHIVFECRAKHSKFITLEANYPHRITTSAQPLSSSSESETPLAKSVVSTAPITPPPALIRYVLIAWIKMRISEIWIYVLGCWN